MLSSAGISAVNSALAGLKMHPLNPTPCGGCSRLRLDSNLSKATFLGALLFFRESSPSVPGLDASLFPSPDEENIGTKNTTATTCGGRPHKNPPSCAMRHART
ncbi:unnamed protein product [Sphacelaria rigidula]